MANDMIHLVDLKKHVKSFPMQLSRNNTSCRLKILQDDGIKSWTSVLNLIPQWNRGVKNRFLVIDEIAYIGECSDIDINHNSPELPELQSTTSHAMNITTPDLSDRSVKQVLITKKKSTAHKTSTNHKAQWSIPKLVTLPSTRILNASIGESYSKNNPYPM
ncbi:hypothetical protein KIN20_023608 [Parelaphostrongylus tenuis]|uniref:Uncharacterized protein n=1 Tax=Parelaphostrongylus tenuis TaxID=148309 RepID=A0AAD5MX70_PARTN|nr:hypothetical protein KIN20_023608 [Parelaphostrongylus tenuis]